jgi:hypothetical protein
MRYISWFILWTSLQTDNKCIEVEKNTRGIRTAHCRKAETMFTDLLWSHSWWLNLEGSELYLSVPERSIRMSFLERFFLFSLYLALSFWLKTFPLMWPPLPYPRTKQHWCFNLLPPLFWPPRYRAVRHYGLHMSDMDLFTFLLLIVVPATDEL